MNRFLTTLFFAALLLTLSGCGKAIPIPMPSASGAAVQPPAPPEESGPLPPSPESVAPDGPTVITLDIGGKAFSATLLDNEAAIALTKRLPLTLEMSELHGNEKYTYLDEGLPTSSEELGQIQAGDMMLYGSDCLVLFYESFASGFRYTRLGSVDDPVGLAQAVGGGGVTVTFSLQ